MSDDHKNQEPRSNEEPCSDDREHRGGDEYKVGRNRPPIHSRFKKGTSGNPKGRRRRAPLDITRQIQDIYLDGVVVNVGGKKKRVSKIIALVQKHLSQALMGDHKSTALSVALAREFGVFSIKEQPEFDFSAFTPEEKQQCLDAFQIIRRKVKLK